MFEESINFILVYTIIKQADHLIKLSHSHLIVIVVIHSLKNLLYSLPLSILYCHL